MEDGLFDLNEESAFDKGDRVVVQTIWGDELGTVRGVTTENGYPMIEVAMERGDRITINVARVRRVT